MAERGAHPWAWPAGAAAVTLALGAPALAGAGFTSRDGVFGAVAIAGLGRAPALGWPLPEIVQADWMLGQALLLAPLQAVGLELSVAYALVCLLGLALGAAAVARVSADALGDGPHALVGGLVGGLGVGHLAHAHHANLVFDGVGWLGLWAAYRAIGRGDRVGAGLAGALAGASFHFGVYIGLHTALVALALVLTAPRGAGPAAVGFGLGALTFLPVAMVYQRADHVLGAGIPAAELVGESLDVAGLVGLGPVRAGHDPGWPGFAAAGLAAVGLTRAGPHRRVALGLAFAAAILALGPSVRWGDVELAPAPYRLLLGVPGIGSLRAPARWLIVTWAALGVFAAAGAQGIGAWTGRPRAVAAVAAVAFFAEAPLLPWGPRATLGPPAIYAALADAPPGPLAEVFGRDRDGCVGAPSVYAAAAHGRPLVGGLFARPYPALMRLNALTRHFPSAASVAALRAVGARVVLVHGESRAPGCEIRDGHAICRLRPRPFPLPAPAAVTTGGAVAVGLRFAAEIPEVVEVTCGERRERHAGEAWETLAGLRAIDGPVGHDLFLDAPCAGAVTVDPEVAFERLSRAPGSPDWPRGG